jgi:hypothetical protein
MTILAAAQPAGCQRSTSAVQAAPDEVAPEVSAAAEAVFVQAIENGLLVRTSGVEGVILRLPDRESPAVSEVVAFERGLATAFREYVARNPDDVRIPAAIANLKRQYYVVDSGGERQVAARMYCVADAEPDWKARPFDKLGGGKCNVRVWWSQVAHTYYLKADGYRAVVLPEK